MLERLFYPRQTLLISSAHNGKKNLMAVNWATQCAEEPPMLAVAIGNSAYTLELISLSREFVVAIPHEGMEDAVLTCGKTSGRFIDKFEEAGLTPEKGRRVNAPLVKEAIANIECKVVSMLQCGECTLVVGEVLEAHFPSEEKEKMRMLFDRGGGSFINI